MRRVFRFYRTSVGKKVTMAVSGGLFVLYVIAHMAGNLKVYQGREAFNHYAEGLREFGAPFLAHGQFLWVARVVLLVAVIVHVVAAIQLWRQSAEARGGRYRKRESLEFSPASRTMRWGGLFLFGFVVYHLMHLTWGSAHPDFIPGDAYHNFVVGFQQPLASAVYAAAMIALGLHLYHGTWSAFQTLGWDGPRIRRVRRPLAAGIALLVVAGNLSFPAAVLAGWIQ